MQKLDKMRIKSAKEIQELLCNGAKSVASVFEDFIKHVEVFQDEERQRVLSLIEQAIEHNVVVAKEMKEKESAFCSYHFLEVQNKALNILTQLKSCISSEEQFLGSIQMPTPFVCKNDGVFQEKSFEASEDEFQEVSDSSCKTGSCLYADKKTFQNATESCSPPIISPGTPFNANDEVQLKQDIIGVMQLAGTFKDGAVARFTFEELSVGLAKLYPFLGDEVLKRVCEQMIEQGMLVPLPSFGGTQNYVLSDDQAAEPAEFSIEDEILRTLKSAKEEGGEYCGWTHNQLIFAVKRSNTRLSEKAIKEEMNVLIEKGCIVSFKGKTTSYVAIDDETMQRYKEKLLAIGHEPETKEEGAEELLEEAVAEVIEEQSEELSESSKHNGDPKIWEKIKNILSLDNAVDAIALTLVMYMRRDPKRLWRDYDLEGLYANTRNKVTMKEPDGKPGELQVALDFLVEQGIVQFIPHDTRPGIHDDRWGLTELGSLLGE